MLGDWVEEVATTSAFWARRFSDAGVAPDAVGDLSDLRALPPVREIDLRDAGGPGGPDLVLRPTPRQAAGRSGLSDLGGISRAIRSPGTDGRHRTVLVDYKPVQLLSSGRDGRLVLAYSRSDLDRLHRAGARAAAVLGLDSDDYLASAVPADGTLRFWSLYHLALGSSILAVHPRGTGDELGVLAAVFDWIPVTAVAVPLAEAEKLAARLAQAGRDLSGVATVITVGPPPAPDRRAAIAAAWQDAGVPQPRVLALWAPPGVRAPWAECAPSARRPDQPVGLHTYPDMDVLEVVSPAGEVVEGAGDLTYTSVGWHGTGLVRYQTGDYVSGIDTGRCPACGRLVPRVLPPVVPAAWEPQIATSSGRVRLDLRGAARVLTGAADVALWRVEVRPRGNHADQGFVTWVALTSGRYRQKELAQQLTAAVGHPPREVALADTRTITAGIQAVGGLFEDSR